MPHNTMPIESAPSTTSLPHLQIGGRKSKLAVVQSQLVQQAIQKIYPDLPSSILALSTLGDKVQTQPLYTFGGKSLWTKELEILLMDGIDDEFPRLDLIVHSLKDMPTNLPEEFELGCIFQREDPRDAIVMKQGSPYKYLRDLPAGSIVGTSSIRRSSQLIKNYPHLKFESVRGNIQTRLNKLDDPSNPYCCLILASAGLIRLGLGGRITSCLDEVYYAVGQGALGIEIRKDDHQVKEILKKIEDPVATICCLAERSLMRYLEGGCSVPLGVHSEYNESTKKLTLKGIIVSPDGSKSIEDEVTKTIESREDCEAVGIDLGDRLKAKGAKEILDSIDMTRNINARPTEV
ncbi:porphobilinogen deaminase [Lodderomyces elongisporus NRRL YB-4239]|uniref:Porphobilinogen deaminase n=1 Tax=Lodderomyces elongisporus (strain ATCC 11503 / CBS 2605 / JCM 1781 / NBRC 1676 / NRRL YB-4239) TaxID=379508 RepID=A5DZ39_LODEL|nr:porphobilinogen deaminase [Lodderomyces elongisporus NRRL YB-4239]